MLLTPSLPSVEMKKSSLEFEAFLALMRGKVGKYWKPGGESGKISRRLAGEKHSRVGVGNRVMDNWSHYKISLQQNFFLNATQIRRHVARHPLLSPARRDSSLLAHFPCTAEAQRSPKAPLSRISLRAEFIAIGCEFSREKSRRKRNFLKEKKIISRISNSGPKHTVRTYRIYPFE